MVQVSLLFNPAEHEPKHLLLFMVLYSVGFTLPQTMVTQASRGHWMATLLQHLAQHGSYIKSRPVRTHSS